MITKSSSDKVLCTIFKIILLSFCYAIVGRISLFLAISPGYATAIFPSAGIALASLLLWGTRLWSGVFLGSLILNLWISYELGDITTVKVFVAVFVATGATLQAVVASKLIHQTIGFPTTLANDRDIFLFLLFSGPISCLINASFGVASLYFADLLVYSNVIYSWFTWWVGDAIGVMLTAPVMFMFFATPKNIWRGRLVVIALPLFGMLSVVITLFIWISHWELESNRFELKEIASDNVEKLRASFISYVDAVAAIERLYVSSTQSVITRNEFRTFVAYTIKSKPGINGLSWNPIVKFNQRHSFEKSLQDEGIGNYKITERNRAGDLITAQEREEYVAVQYIEPLASNIKALGYDVASNSSRRKALNDSRDQAKAFATARITLVQEEGEQAGFLLFYPVYKGQHKTIDERRKNIKGFAVGVFRVGDIANEVLDKIIINKAVVGIYDVSDGLNGHLYGPKKSDYANRNIFSVAETITLGGRQWNIIFWPSADYMASHGSWQAWAALALGLLFTSVLGAFLLSITGKSDYLNSEVKSRTVEIEKHRLEIQKTNRILAERNKQLERSNQELDHYAFVASHDLKSPLQAIEQLANWIDEDCQNVLPDSSREHLTLLKQRILRMKKLLADLLMFARVSRENYGYENVDLQEIIEKAIQFNCIPSNFNVSIKNCEIILNLPIVPIELALRNLLSNAVKHHDKIIGAILIEYDKNNDEHILSLSDNGPGIPSHLHQTAVEMFHTLKSRDVTEGSGLGLSIVNKAMERLGGYLKIVSDGANGTKVELHWPT